jgi:transaldolase|tara:strand:- start:53 stop:730 length:678 start_codon:yes stop_codon:yes gene_type:complete
MKIFLDTSDINIIRKYYDTGLIDGVTTNPTLMMQSGRNPINVIKDISTLFPKESSISAEVVGDTAEEMISQAKAILRSQSKEYRKISQNITIKVPCSVEGLKACKTLSDLNISVNVTLIFSVQQAILSAKAGATYVSPFIGRLEDNNSNGIELIKSIYNVYYLNDVSTEILAASIRNLNHIEYAFEAGADIVTIPPKLFEEMYQHDLTDQGIAQFDKDWKKINHK